MITQAANAWGRHASSPPLLISRAAFTAAAAGKGKDSTKSEAQGHKKEALALAGCGKMGLAMGRNFLKAGYPLLVHDKHNAEAVAKLVAEVRIAGGRKQEEGRRRRVRRGKMQRSANLYPQMISLRAIRYLLPHNH